MMCIYAVPQPLQSTVWCSAVHARPRATACAFARACPLTKLPVPCKGQPLTPPPASRGHLPKGAVLPLQQAAAHVQLLVLGVDAQRLKHLEPQLCQAVPAAHSERLPVLPRTPALPLHCRHNKTPSSAGALLSASPWHQHQHQQKKTSPADASMFQPKATE
eukprot:GHRQ01031675.1.p1 GENE.GHRQ01031675.1~~GHRQ01031675.1.p1  ORF type:complete len:161 (-),score=23.71 GHRQ01031675.1:223-705(-)